MQTSIERLTRDLAEQGYIADSSLATALALMDTLERPLLVEGEAGVGKTAMAAALAASREAKLIRLQCYEGIDVSSALYEWDYPRQLLAMQALVHRGEGDTGELYSEKYLQERPLLQAIRQPKSPVLLIDEIDRADEAFEAFLLEVLSEFTVSIPEIGTISAITRPSVILTSNDTRELSDALRRRCLYHYCDYPTFERELEILRLTLPDVDEQLLTQVTGFVQRIRDWDVSRRPGIAESIDWARALAGFGVENLEDSGSVVNDTVSCLLKTPEDLQVFSEQGEELLASLNG